MSKTERETVKEREKWWMDRTPREAVLLMNAGEDDGLVIAAQTDFLSSSPRTHENQRPQRAKTSETRCPSLSGPECLAWRERLAVWRQYHNGVVLRHGASQGA